ncbi:hypothetical protein COO60DRAFT_1458110 [Scenedesmus sp. NREL 46B-D3]|nr:hypothetical protein COO60DRAFT_1458110 [Scenedesmus sp. NREL 46B-D3]
MLRGLFDDQLPELLVSLLVWLQQRSKCLLLRQQEAVAARQGRVNSTGGLWVWCLACLEALAGLLSQCRRKGTCSTTQHAVQLIQQLSEKAAGEVHAGIGSKPLAYLAAAHPEAYSHLIDCCVRSQHFAAHDTLLAADLLQHALACDAPEPGGAALLSHPAAAEALASALVTCTAGRLTRGGSGCGRQHASAAVCTLANKPPFNPCCTPGGGKLLVTLPHPGGAAAGDFCAKQKILALVSKQLIVDSRLGTQTSQTHACRVRHSFGSALAKLELAEVQAGSTSLVAAQSSGRILRSSLESRDNRHAR